MQALILLKPKSFRQLTKYDPALTVGLSADKLAQLLSQPATACICETCLSRIKRELAVSVTSENKNSPSGLGDGLGYEVK